MTDETRARLKEKYKDRNLLEELSWGTYGVRPGYLRKTDSEFINWLCDMAYDRITELEEKQRCIKR